MLCTAKGTALCAHVGEAAAFKEHILQWNRFNRQLRNIGFKIFQNIRYNFYLRFALFLLKHS